MEVVFMKDDISLETCHDLHVFFPEHLFVEYLALSQLAQ